MQLSEIRNAIRNSERIAVSNNHIKDFLLEEFGENNIKFCDSDWKNESSTVFSANLSPEVLSEKLRSIKCSERISRNFKKRSTEY